MSNETPIALITGAGKRIGRHLASQLAKVGWDIAAHYNRSNEGIRELGKEVEDQGQKFIALQADLKDEQAISGLVPECAHKLGAPTLLINNASLFEKDEIGTIEGALFDDHININLKAPILLAQSFAGCLDKTRQGTIINITDQRVYRPSTDFYSYTISKAGLAAATKTMAEALAPSIRVNAIAPGPVLQSIHQTKAEFETECKATLLGHGTTLDEIMAAVTFILQTHSLTGETIHLDGGQRFQ